MMVPRLRIVFMGTPEFAVPTLRALASAHEVVAVYTRPDAVSGRGRTLHPTPVKSAALELGIAVRQPSSLRDPAEVVYLRGVGADVCVVAAYGALLPTEILESFALGCINVHASLLPSWRGAAPIQRAILAGDERVGVSIMRMEEGLDTGPYCATAATIVDGKSVPQLTDELAELGARLLADALPRIASGTCDWISQDESEATYAAKITKDDVRLEPTLSVTEALRRVQASSPTAPSRLRLGTTGITLLSATRADDAGVAPGEIRSTRTQLLLGFTDGAIAALTIKPDGRNSMDGAAWGRGQRIDTTTRWESV